MDLVTLVTVCAIGSGTPLAPENEHRVRAVTLAAKDLMDRWQPLIVEASRRFGIPAEWIRAVMRAESAGRTTLDGRPITSPAGAMGLMQVMPDTYKAMRQALGLGSDPYDPRDNIVAGTAYLAAMYNRFGYPGLFAAYNAGPERYEAWFQHGTPLPAETLAYLRAISSDVPKNVLAMGAATDSGGSGSTRLASSRPQIEPKFQSGKSLFFVLGNRTFAALEPPNQAVESAPQDADQPSIFATPGRESHPSAASKIGTLFVPLSHRAE